MIKIEKLEKNKAHLVEEPAAAGIPGAAAAAVGDVGEPDGFF